MFWKNWSWSARILSICGVGLIAAILFPVFTRPRESGGRRNPCPSNLKQIGLGIMQYTQDYDEKFPLVTTGHSAYGWADALQPYLKSTQIYQCQLEPTAPVANPRKSGYTDYPFNKRLSAKPLATIADLNKQILSLDGNAQGDVTDARYSLPIIPPQWRDDQNSPLYRHLDTANFLFADGHVKSLTPSQLSTDTNFVF